MSQKPREEGSRASGLPVLDWADRSVPSDLGPSGSSTLPPSFPFPQILQFTKTQPPPRELWFPVGLGSFLPDLAMGGGVCGQGIREGGGSVSTFFGLPNTHTHTH